AVLRERLRTRVIEMECLLLIADAIVSKRGVGERDFEAASPCFEGDAIARELAAAERVSHDLWSEMRGPIMCHGVSSECLVLVSTHIAGEVRMLPSMSSSLKSAIVRGGPSISPERTPETGSLVLTVNVKSSFSAVMVARSTSTSICESP